MVPGEQPSLERQAAVRVGDQRMEVLTVERQRPAAIRSVVQYLEPNVLIVGQMEAIEVVITRVGQAADVDGVEDDPLRAAGVAVGLGLQPAGRGRRRSWQGRG